MRSLISDRFLNKFVESFLRRRGLILTEEMRSKQDDGEDVTNKLGSSENQNMLRKEAQENNDQADELTQPTNQKNELDRSSSAAQWSDDHE